jgi:hypothetical protein
MASLLTDLLFHKAAAAEAGMDREHATRDERKAAIESILVGDQYICSEVEQNKAEREKQDRYVTEIEDDTMRFAQLGSEGYALALQVRTARRMDLGRSMLKQAEYRRAHDLPALKAELNAIIAEENDEERAAARAKLLQLMIEFQHEILDRGAELQVEIDRRLDEAERKWPQMRVAFGLPHVPVGIFSLVGGLRSIPGWHRECLVAAEPQMFDADDPVRVKFENERKAGKQPTIWHPGSPPWA